MHFVLSKIGNWQLSCFPGASSRVAIVFTCHTDPAWRSRYAKQQQFRGTLNTPPALHLPGVLNLSSPCAWYRITQPRTASPVAVCWRRLTHNSLRTQFTSSIAFLWGACSGCSDALGCNSCCSDGEGLMSCMLVQIVFRKQHERESSGT